METYTETVNRYRIMRHDDLPEGHKAELRAHGIDPDTRWSLIWSFDDERMATEMFESCQDDAASWETFKMVDAGEATTIERGVW